MTDGIELNHVQNEIREVLSSESENELVESAPEQRGETTKKLFAGAGGPDEEDNRWPPSKPGEGVTVTNTCEGWGRRSVLCFSGFCSFQCMVRETRKKLFAGAGGPDEEDNRSPPWLKQFLGERFFVQCKLHADSHKSECDMNCLDCMDGAHCSLCLSHHKDHRAIKVLRSTEHRDGGKKHMKLLKQICKVTWSDKNLAQLITVMVLIAGAVYMVLFSFHDAFPISAMFTLVNLSIGELLTFPGAATDDFLFITTVTTTFILSMGMIAIAVCILFRKFIRGTFLTILSLFTIAAFSLSFFTMLSKFIPNKITIAGGNLKIPATAIVIFYDIYVIILVCAFAYAVHRWRSSRRKQDAVVERESIV